MKTPAEALADVLGVGGVPLDAGRLTLTGSDPVYETRFLLGTAGAAALGAGGLAAAAIWKLRTGVDQAVSLDVGPAAAALRSDRYLRIDGKPASNPWAPLSGFYRTGDGRWMQFHCNFPHHRDGVVRLLGCGPERANVEAAALGWNAPELEDALAAAGMCAGMVRTREEWLAHPQAAAVRGLPLFEVIRLSDSPPEPLGPAGRPLGGIRALDLTRVLAGPVATRTLAEHGADVLRITAAHLPALAEADIDTGHGKLAAQLDLRSDADHQRLMSLVRQADIFCQAYRPGTLAGRGFSPEALAMARPGIIYATLSAYGHEGPWRERRGFDSLVQTVSGIVDEESGAGAPRHLPAQALDYVSGYLLAFGIVAALLRRAAEGGSYLVRVSLAQTAEWIQGLGRAAQPGLGLSDDEVETLLQEEDSPFGRLRHLGPVIRMEGTQPHWVRPAVHLNHNGAAWPEA